MTDKYWGPLTWKALHSITYNYPENPNINVKKTYVHFFNKIVPNMLPCIICFNHYLKYISSRPIHNYINNKTDLVRWLVDMHNSINRRNNKPILSYWDVDNIYKNKIYFNDINQLILYNRKRVQYRYLKPQLFNQIVFFLNLSILKILPTTYNI